MSNLLPDTSSFYVLLIRYPHTGNSLAATCSPDQPGNWQCAGSHLCLL